MDALVRGRPGCLVTLLGTATILHSVDNISLSIPLRPIEGTEGVLALSSLVKVVIYVVTFRVPAFIVSGLTYSLEYSKRRFHRENVKSVQTWRYPLLKLYLLRHFELPTRSARVEV